MLWMLLLLLLMIIIIVIIIILASSSITKGDSLNSKKGIVQAIRNKNNTLNRRVINGFHLKAEQVQRLGL